MEKLGINLGFFLFQVFNFLILAILLYAWAYKPVLKMLENRKQKIAQELEDARIAADARANAEKEAAKIIADAQAEASKLVREAAERAEAAAREARTHADTETTKARESALGEIEAEHTRLLSDLRSEVAALSIAAAQKLIGAALDEKRQHALLDEFFSGVKDGKIVLLEEGGITGQSAEIISALPLTDAEKTTINKVALTKIGAKDISFQVDPSILGGLIIRVGDKVLDGSVSGKLENLRQSLR